MARIELTARADAPRDVVWEVLTASDDWADWAGEITHSVRVSEGEGHPDGVGAVRELWAAGVLPLRERVEAFDPDSGRYGYSLFAVPPVKDYLADVHLTGDGDATTIRWAVEVRSILPVPGASQLLAAGVKLVIGRLLSALVTESERRAALVTA